MPRNPDYQFVSTDTTAIVASLVAAWERMTGRTLPPASPDMLFIRWVAGIIILERAQLNFAANQNIPSRAENENLDALGELLGNPERPGAQAAVCTQRFFISAAQSTSVLIPAGTKVTDSSGVLVWETTENVYIPAGSIFADVPARCQTPGITGNGYETGQISRLVDVDNIAYYERCENITVSDGGADRASDEAYYNLMRESQDARSTAGLMGGYVYYAKSVSTEIIDAIANSPSPGVVAIYALMRSGEIAGDEIKSRILSVCSADDLRPLTDFVSVRDPEIVRYDIDLTYYIPNTARERSALIEAAVWAAVRDYTAWQFGRMGRDINPDELRQRVKETGVKRVELRSPAFTVLKNGRETDAPAPQIAAVGTINLVNGGYEDE